MNAAKNKPAPWLGEYNKVQRNAHSTKAGPGRRPKHGGEKTAKQKAAGSYGKGLTAWRTGKPSKGRI